MMKIHVRNKVDCEAGAFFFAIGLVIVFLASDYNMGTALNMGPGYFPHALGLVLSALGAAILVRGLLDPTIKVVTAFHGRQVVVVTLAIVAFAFALLASGLLLAVPVMVIIALFASPGYRWRQALPLAALLTVGAWLVFHVALGLRMPLFGGLD
jgi:hypothetical protein